jgi:hypothetical protein
MCHRTNDCSGHYVAAIKKKLNEDMGPGNLFAISFPGGLGRNYNFNGVEVKVEEETYPGFQVFSLTSVSTLT